MVDSVGKYTRSTVGEGDNMLTVIVFLAVCSGVVWLIDWNSNRNYYSVVRLHEIHVEAAYVATEAGVSSMDWDDIVDVLCKAKICVELNHDLYFNNIDTQKGYGHRCINKLDAVKVLATLLVGV